MSNEIESQLTEEEKKELAIKKVENDALEYERKLAELEGEKLEMITKKLVNSEMFNNSAKTISSELLDILTKSDDMYNTILQEMRSISDLEVDDLEKKLLFGDLMVQLMKVAGEQSDKKIKSLDTLSKFIPKTMKTQINQAQSLKVDDIVRNNNNFGTNDYIGVLQTLSDQGMSMITAIRVPDKDTYGVVEADIEIVNDKYDPRDDDFGESDKYEDEDEVEIDFDSIKRNVDVIDDFDDDEIEVIHSPKLEDFEK